MHLPSSCEVYWQPQSPIFSLSLMARSKTNTGFPASQYCMNVLHWQHCLTSRVLNDYSYSILRLLYTLSWQKSKNKHPNGFSTSLYIYTGASETWMHLRDWWHVHRHAAFKLRCIFIHTHTYRQTDTHTDTRTHARKHTHTQAIYTICPYEHIKWIHSYTLK